MAICPHCQTHTDAPLTPCPSADGFYTVDDEEFAAFSDDPMLGRSVGGRFIVTSVLGRGAMGLVYRAHQEGVDRDVALKVFRQDNLLERSLGRKATNRERERAEARFVQEAKVLGKLSHPNCVTVYDFGVSDDDDFLFMAMEYVAGISLRQAIKRGLKFDAIVELIRQILEALREAHSLGIVHRDLKPENIVLSYRFTSGEHVVKVLDFGIAKLLQSDQESSTRVGALFGTPAYMSPEQCRGEVSAISPASDVYALGCMFYEMVCGRLPYMAQVPQQMVQMHLFDPVPQVYPRPNISPSRRLKAFITRCMDKDPKERFADAGAALAAFEAIVAEESDLAQPKTAAKLEGVARSLRSQSGKGANPAQVVVPRDAVTGEHLSPFFDPEAKEKRARPTAVGEDMPAVATGDTQPPDGASVERSALVEMADEVDLKTAGVIAAVVVVLVFTAIVFYLIYGAIVG